MPIFIKASLQEQIWMIMKLCKILASFVHLYGLPSACLPLFCRALYNSATNHPPALVGSG